MRHGKSEGGALAGPVAVDGERAAEFFGGQGAAVQAETMAVPASREAMGKDAGQMLGTNADAIVDDLDGDRFLLRRKDADGQTFVMPFGSAEGVLGVANEVDEDLEDPVLVQRDRWHRSDLGFETNLVTIERGGIDLNGVLDELTNLDRLLNARDLRVALLHGNDLIDVLDVFAELAQLAKEKLIFFLEGAGCGFDIFGNTLAFGVGGEETIELAGVLAEQFGNAGKIGEVALFDAGRDDGARDVDAVERVADIVENVGGDFGHPGETRGLEKTFVCRFEFGFGTLEFRDIA